MTRLHHSPTSSYVVWVLIWPIWPIWPTFLYNIRCTFKLTHVDFKTTSIPIIRNSPHTPIGEVHSKDLNCLTNPKAILNGDNSSPRRCPYPTDIRQITLHSLLQLIRIVLTVSVVSTDVQIGRRISAVDLRPDPPYAVDGSSIFFSVRHPPFCCIYWVASKPFSTHMTSLFPGCLHIMARRTWHPENPGLRIRQTGAGCPWGGFMCLVSLKL